MSTIVKIRKDSAANWTSANPTLNEGELGYETDTGYIKLGDGSTAWTSLSYIIQGSASALDSTDIGVSVQAWSSVLDTIAALSASENAFLSGNGSTIVASSAADTRTALGYGTYATQNTVAPTDFASGVPVTLGGTGSTSAGAARTALGLEIGTDVQAYAPAVLTDPAVGSSVQAYDSNLTSFVSTFTLPTSDGTSSQAIKTNGSGILSFLSVSAGVSIDTVLPDNPGTGALYYIPDEDKLYAFDGSDWYMISLSTYSTYVPYVFQGSNYGYASGGAVPLQTTRIDKFPFSTDANSTFVGDLTVKRRYGIGQSSSEYGYTSGGDATPTVPGLYTNLIDKFPFATDTDATDVGDLTAGRWNGAGQSSGEYGYTTGGGGYPPSLEFTTIDKFPVAADANATAVGDLTAEIEANIGQSSTTHGYSSGGLALSAVNVIEKFPFSTDANATDIGDLTIARTSPAGQSSESYGYNSGGGIPGGVRSNIIDKFPFASDTNATDVSDLTVARSSAAPQSSTTHGYSSGGSWDSPTASNVIDKFSFITDANATDVGDLYSKYTAAGQQY